MEISTEKMKILVNSKDDILHINIRIDRAIFEEVGTFKYLGACIVYYITYIYIYITEYGTSEAEILIIL